MFVLNVNIVTCLNLNCIIWTPAGLDIYTKVLGCWTRCCFDGDELIVTHYCSSGSSRSNLMGDGMVGQVHVWYSIRLARRSPNEAKHRETQDHLMGLGGPTQLRQRLMLEKVFRLQFSKWKYILMSTKTMIFLKAVLKQICCWKLLVASVNQIYSFTHFGTYMYLC